MNFGPATIVADPEARGKLLVSIINHNVNSCRSAFLGVLDAVGVADLLLAHFLMNVCGGCVSEVAS